MNNEKSMENIKNYPITYIGIDPEHIELRLKSECADLMTVEELEAIAKIAKQLQKRYNESLAR